MNQQKQSCVLHKIGHRVISPIWHFLGNLLTMIVIFEAWSTWQVCRSPGCYDQRFRELEINIISCVFVLITSVRYCDYYWHQVKKAEEAGTHGKPGNLSHTHIQCNQISLALNFFLSCLNLLKFCTEHSSDTVELCANFEQEWTTKMDITDGEILRGLSLRWVVDEFPAKACFTKVTSCWCKDLFIQHERSFQF